MATGVEFFAQLEKRFNQLPAEEKLDKIVEYQKKLTALKEQGLSEEEAVAQLESELPRPAPCRRRTTSMGASRTRKSRS